MRRLVLFDIDGTLLNAGGAGRRAFHAALERVYGTPAYREGYSFGGRTDPQIVMELLSGHGWDRATVEARFDDLWREYLHVLRHEFDAAPPRTLPGVPAVLDRVQEAGGDVVLGLLTGNVVDGARMKIDAAGLGFERFRVGAYGSDHADRPELPAVAARRARELTGTSFAGKEIVIIGDTPFDISCGAHMGVRTIAVATGGHPAEELAGCGPDHLFRDLTDTDAVWKAIAE
jgi:phosphoglycolate phosphatase-like HAD superfamily hydrolase